MSRGRVRILATAGNDTLTGTNGADRVWGYAGDDVLDPWIAIIHLGNSEDRSSEIAARRRSSIC